MTHPSGEHQHTRRFDGDDPYLICDCGKRWDVLTGNEVVPERQFAPSGEQPEAQELYTLLENYETELGHHPHPPRILAFKKVIDRYTAKEIKAVLDRLTNNSNLYDEPRLEKELFYAVWKSDIEAERKRAEERGYNVQTLQER